MLCLRTRDGEDEPMVDDEVISSSPHSSSSHPITTNKVADVISLSPSLTYDPIVSELCVRGNNIGSNIALLFLAIKVSNGDYNIKDIHRQGLFSSHMEQNKSSINVLQTYNQIVQMLNVKKPISNEQINKKRFNTNFLI